MKRLFWMVLFTSLFALTAQAEGARSYDNPRYGISLHFPEGFFRMPPTVSGDEGAIFQSMDGKGQLLILAKNTSASLKQIYELMLAQMQKSPEQTVTYSKFAGDWYVLSTLNEAKGLISYQKGYKRGSFYLLYLLSYPREQKGRYALLIENLNRQFGPPRTGRVRSGRVGHSRPRHRLSGQQCDAAARGCYASCPDEDDGCLDRCEARRDRCYRSGRF
ncbi:hypothetical protein [Nitratifractor sp.]